MIVGIKGHAMAGAVAEVPKGVARALLYIVRASPSFFIHHSRHFCSGRWEGIGLYVSHVKLGISY